MSKLKKNIYLISRRIIQIFILILFVGAYRFEWSVLKGNFSAAKVLDKFYIADPFAVMQMLFAGKFPSFDIIIGALIIAVFYALIFGRSFCSWVCPMNIITDASNWFRKILNLKHPNVLRIDRKTRYWVLLLSLILSFILSVAAFEFISPISILHRAIIYGIGFSWLIILFVFLLDLFIREHLWCGYICPLGAFYSAISPKSALKIYHYVEKCDPNCKDCKTVCPEVQVLHIIGKKSGKITSGECTNCGRCIDVCPQDALKFSFLKK